MRIFPHLWATSMEQHDGVGRGDESKKKIAHYYHNDVKKIFLLLFALWLVGRHDYGALVVLVLNEQ